MKELKYIEKIRNEDSLLSMPQSISEILSMVNSEDFSMEDLSKIILRDTALTSKILKMANSAFYRQRTEISTVHQAVVMLGMMQVKCLALSTSVFQPGLLENKYGINVKELFSHFISVALGCRMLAAEAGAESTEEMFIAGLLHDIGMIFFINHFPEDYAEVLKRNGEYPTLIAAEKDILAIDHCTIGQMLAEKWHFPVSLCEAIGRHHQLPESIDRIEVVNYVQLSELLNKPYANERPGNLETRLAAIGHMSSMMKIDRKKIDDISLSLLTETISTAEYLGIDIGDPIEVLERANKELFDSYITIESLFRERQDLSRRILIEERRSAMMETKNVAIATLSHYINNSAMAISGRAQLIKMLQEKGIIKDDDKRLAPILDVMEKSIKKILAVLMELRDLTNLDELEKYSQSQALNIDDRIQERLRQMEREDGAVIRHPNYK